MKNKYFLSIFSAFVVGIVVTLIPSLMTISSLKDNGVPPFQFVPNSVGFANPIYAMDIKTSDQVEKIKSSGILDAQKAEIGGVIDFGTTGLFVVPADEVKSTEYHMNSIAPQKDKKVIFGGVYFVPDILVTFEPLKMQVIHTEIELEQVKKADWINNKEGLSIGAAVRCPESGSCFILHKSTLEKEYKKIQPLNTYRPAGNTY